MTSLKNATQLKARNPEALIYVLQRDLLTYGVEHERYYRQAMEAGVDLLEVRPELSELNARAIRNEGLSISRSREAARPPREGK